MLLLTMEPKSKIFSDGNKNLHYYVRGNGKSPVIVLHGLGSSGLSFYNGVDISLSNTTTYYIDLPGHGDSFDLVLKKPEEWVSLITNFCKSLDSKKIAIVGFSLGGEIGLLVAEKLIEKGYECSLFAWSASHRLNHKNPVSFIAELGMSLWRWLNVILRSAFVRKVLSFVGIRLAGQDWNDVVNTNPYTFRFAKKLFKRDMTDIDKRIRFKYIYGDYDAFVNYKKVVPEIEKVRPGCSIYISGCQHFGNEVGWKNAVKYLKEEISI